jgi:hypothetical protein
LAFLGSFPHPSCRVCFYPVHSFSMSPECANGLDRTIRPFGFNDPLVAITKHNIDKWSLHIGPYSVEPCTQWHTFHVVDYQQRVVPIMPASGPSRLRDRSVSKFAPMGIEKLAKGRRGEAGLAMLWYDEGISLTAWWHWTFTANSSTCR